jgi:hypothetical protein
VFGETYFPEARLWVKRAKTRPEDTGIGILKVRKCIFLRNFVFTTGSFELASVNMSSVVVEVVALTARF